MGNNMCCQQASGNQFDALSITINKDQLVKVPQLNPVVTMHLKTHKPFYMSLPNKSSIKVFGDDLYEGCLDSMGRPNGYGKMYYKNGSVFIGQFFGGIADGPGHFVRCDGSYYNGRMKNNKAYDQNGFFRCSYLQYSGGIFNNEFEGNGKQKGQFHSFQGKYKKGQKVSGVLKWFQGPDYYQYQGNFDAFGNLSGAGKLYQKGKGTYIGDFLHGNKHGLGQFAYQTGLTYIGQYSYNQKQGYGKLVNKNGSISYQGYFRNGLPHGKGTALNLNGVMVPKIYIDGIDALSLQA